MRDGDLSFGPFLLDRHRRTLLREGHSVPVNARGVALLEALATADGAPVSREKLLEIGWPGLVVEDSNLTVQIAALRKTLGIAPDGTEWIATVPRVGYRLAQVVGLEVPPPKRLPTIGVLPFQDLSGEASQEYFADGIVDDLIAALSRFKSFAVIGRGASFAGKGLRGETTAVAATLGVDYLLQGSVRRAGKRLRLIAELSSGTDGATLWAETFEGPVGNLFDFQDRITRSVAAVVEPQVQHAELDRAIRKRSGDMSAYDLYLRGLAKMYVHSPEANAEAFHLLQRALAIEPDNAVYLSTASWALEYRLSVSWPPISPDDRKLCVALALRALALAGDNARVLGNCGLTIQSNGGEFDRGQLVVKRAVSLNPNDLALLHVAGVSHFIGGDFEEGLNLLHRAIDVQPNHAYEAMGIAAVIYEALGRHEDALAWATRANAINGKYIVSHWAAAAACAHLDRMVEARAILATILSLSPGSTIERITHAFLVREPQRMSNILEGLRLAGMPET
jgi:TolB-like protein